MQTASAFFVLYALGHGAGRGFLIVLALKPVRRARQLLALRL